MLSGYNKVFILGCDTCVSVCMVGGKKEVGVLAAQLRMSFKKDGKAIQIDEDTVERQCNREYMELILEKLQDYDVVMTLACSAGAQLLADLCEPLQVLPGVNTRFIGMTPQDGTWVERCRACGDCVLGETGIMGWFCQGFGFGEIDLAYGWRDEYHVSVTDIFNMRISGMGWGAIKQELEGKIKPPKPTHKPTHTPKPAKKP